MHIGGALGVGDAFRITGRPGGVTEHHRRSLVEIGPVPILGCIGNQVLVRDRSRDLLVGLRTHHHIGHNRLQLGHDRCQQRNQIRIDEKHPVAGVVDDVGNLIREETDVDRVTDQARVRSRPIQLMMTPVVPRKRGDCVTGGQPQPSQGRRQTAEPHICLPVRGSSQRSIGLHREDLLVGVETDRPLIEGRQIQLEIVLHVRHQPSPNNFLFSASNSSEVSLPSS